MEEIYNIRNIKHYLRSTEHELLENTPHARVELLHYHMQQAPNLGSLVLVNLLIARQHVVEAVVQLNRLALRDVLGEYHALICGNLTGRNNPLPAQSKNNITTHTVKRHTKAS